MHQLKEVEYSPDEMTAAAACLPYWDRFQLCGPRVITQASHVQMHLMIMPEPTATPLPSVHTLLLCRFILLS
jgi:hypothetical protein